MINLYESKIDYILQNKKVMDLIAKKYLKDINFSTEKMTEDQIRQAAEYVLKKCEELPYTNKYMIWLIKQYIQGKFIIPEDLSKLNSELEKFSKINHKLEKKDISNYSWDEFLEVIPKLEEIHTSNEEKRIAKAGAEKLFENDKWVVIHPKTEEASCYYGKGTRWCTAATEGANYFDRYNDEGNLYILINKQNPEEKYQFHFQTGSFMDANDSPIDVDDTSKIFKDKELLSFLYTLSDKEIGLENLPKNLEQYNGDEFDIDILDLRSIYKEASRDGISFEFVEELLTDIPDSWYFDLNTNEYVKYEFEYDTLPKKILNVFVSKGLNVGDNEEIYLEEIKKSYLNEVSDITTLENIISTVKEETDADNTANDIYVTSTYNDALQDVLSQLSEQLNMEVYQKEGTIVSLKPKAESTVEHFRDSIKLYKLFGDSIIPYYDTYIDTVIASIFAIYLDGEVISFSEPYYGWSKFDSNEFKNFINDIFCYKLEETITEEDIKKIEKEIEEFEKMWR